LNFASRTECFKCNGTTKKQDIQDRLNHNENFDHIFPKFDFTSVFPDSSAYWLNTMYEVVQETIGGQK